MGSNRIDKVTIWEEYTLGKQTYAQLSKKYGCSIKTIQRRLDTYFINNTQPKARKVIVLMDTTYWGRNFGAMLFKDAKLKTKCQQCLYLILVLMLNPKFRAFNQVRQIFVIWLYNKKDKTK